MINKLPSWCIVNKFPAFYDTESATAIEQTARIYGKMNELVEAYNAFAENTTNALNTFIGETEQEYETFKVAIRQEFQDFINTIDLKMLDIENDIKAFEETTDQKLTGFAADIAAFKTSITTAFSTFKSEVNTTLNNYQRNIDNFKEETNTALSSFENRVNATLQQMQDDLNEYIEMTKTVTGANVISITENKDFMHNVVMASSAPANTKVNIYDKNFANKSSLYNKTVYNLQGNTPINLNVTGLVTDDESGDDWGTNTNGTITYTPNWTQLDGIAYARFKFENIDQIQWNDPYSAHKVAGTTSITIDSDELQFDIVSNLTPENDYLIVLELNAHTSPDAPSDVKMAGNVYLVEENAQTTATVDNTGNVSIADISPTTVAMIEPAQFANGYNLNLSYVISDFATKRYIDNKTSLLAAKIEGFDKWEEIRVITTTEDKTDLDIDLGNQYKKIFVIIDESLVTGTTYSSIRMGGTREKSDGKFYISDTVNTNPAFDNTKKYKTFYEEIIGDFYFYKATSESQLYGYVNKEVYFGQALKEYTASVITDNFKHLYLWAGTIYANTTIKIYGVKV